MRDVRNLVKRIQTTHNTIESDINLLIKSLESVVLKNELLHHENQQLIATLSNERKRRKRGKPLGLIGKDEPKYGQFFSPQKILLRRQEMAAEEAQKEHKEQQAAEDKLNKQIERDRKALEHRERVEFNKQQRAMKKAQRLAEQDLRR